MIRERALKVVLVLVGLVFSAGILSRGDLCTGWLASEQGGRFADDAEPLCHARDFPAAGSAQTVSESQRDRFRRMVKFCACLSDGCHGNPPCERTPRSAGGRG